MSAKDGIFRTFSDPHLLSHLQLSDLKSIQHMDPSTGIWVTLLPNSPPIRVRQDSKHHFKEQGASVAVDSIVKPKGRPEVIYQPSTPMRSPFMQATPMYNAPPKKETSPTITRTNPWLDDSIGSRPSRITRFSRSTVGEMTDRLAWMKKNKDRGTLSERFGMMFATTFSSSTYHRHNSALRWLDARGRITRLVRNDPWLPLAKQAWDALKGETIDLTKDDPIHSGDGTVHQKPEIGRDINEFHLGEMTRNNGIEGAVIVIGNEE